MAYIDYRHRMEFTREQFNEITDYCNEKNIIWFASCWDEVAVDFIEDFNPVMYKIASASLTDKELLLKHKSLNKPLMLSTGMSTLEEIETAVNILGKDNLMLAHSTSSYPCSNNELNLRMIHTLQKSLKQFQ